MTETFKSVPGFEGIYEVSDHGTVRSLERTVAGRAKKDGTPSERKLKARELKPNVGAQGFKRLSLVAGDKPKFINVHRLVAEAFVPQEVSAGEILTGNVLFKDGDKLNCHADNLEWETRPSAE